LNAMATRAAEIQDYLIQSKELVDSLLDLYLPPAKDEPKTLHAAMRYSVLAGGKRIRPILALASYECCSGDSENLEPIHRAMAAIEIIHTYSLIHDDLPCMDDDDLRRGIPTCHKKYGEAVAVLAGDALHDIAFSLMASTGKIETVQVLAEAIGTGGMLGGQIADIEAEGKELTETEITSIHRRKTAALIRCAVLVGAILAKADDQSVARMAVFGEKIGLAFQIIDDILDIEGDQKLMGKKTGADSKMEKATYPKVVGIEKAKVEAERLIDDANRQLTNCDNETLKEIAQYIGQRSH